MIQFPRSTPNIALLISGILLACWACQAPAPQHEFTGEKAFRTTDPSRLFFSNVRSSNYYYERPKGTEVDLYRNRKFSQTTKRPILIPIIVNAWIKSEAYLFIRPNDFADIANPLVVAWQSDTLAGRYTMGVPTRAVQYKFATQLYQSIHDGHNLQVMLQDSSFAPIYESRTERAAFMATTQDYYRLTERI